MKKITVIEKHEIRKAKRRWVNSLKECNVKNQFLGMRVVHVGNEAKMDYKTTFKPLFLES